MNLTARTFDDLTATAEHSPRVLWGLKSIAVALNVTIEFVADVLAKEEGTPIRKIGRRYVVIEQDLLDFIRR